MEYTYTKKAHYNGNYYFYTGNGLSNDRMYGGIDNGERGGNPLIRPDVRTENDVTTYYPIFVKGTIYTYNLSERVPALEQVILGNESNDGWLASQCVNATQNYITYRLRRACSTKVSGGNAL